MKISWFLLVVRALMCLVTPLPAIPLITRPKPLQFITRQKHRFCTGKRPDLVNAQPGNMNRFSILLFPISGRIHLNYALSWVDLARRLKISHHPSPLSKIWSARPKMADFCLETSRTCKWMSWAKYGHRIGDKPQPQQIVLFVPDKRRITVLSVRGLVDNIG